jgi:acyl-CoA synthetase (AMP-forming)/AMP-acid ligase II
LIDYFDDLARATGQFLVYDDGFRARGRSYAEVARAARGFASRLADAGVRQGDEVLFWSENRPEWIVAFWGCLIAGVIVVEGWTAGSIAPGTWRGPDTCT